jgi:hypothetical protein
MPSKHEVKEEVGVIGAHGIFLIWVPFGRSARTDTPVWVSVCGKNGAWLTLKKKSVLLRGSADFWVTTDSSHA